MSTVFGSFGNYIVLISVHLLNNCYVFVFAMYLRDKGYHGFIMSVSNVYIRSFVHSFIHSFIHLFIHLFVQNQVIRCSPLDARY